MRGLARSRNTCRIPVVATRLFDGAISAPLAVFILLAPGLAFAQDAWRDWRMAAPFDIHVNFFLPSLNTTLRVDASDGSPGTPINFEQNLNYDDTENVIQVGFGWRFAEKHRLMLGYYRLDRSGSDITVTDIDIGDDTFSGMFPISSFLDYDVIRFAYTYSILMNEQDEFGFDFGISYLDITSGFFGNDALGGDISQRSEATTPVPTIGISGGHAFNDKWYFRGNVEYLPLDLSFDDGDGLEGILLTAGAGIYHHTFDNWRFGLSWLYYDLDVSYGTMADFTSLKYTYHGPAINVVASF